MFNNNNNENAPAGSNGVVSDWSDSIVWFVFSVLIGLTSTALLFMYFVRVDEERVAVQTERGLEALVAFAAEPFLRPLMLELTDTLTRLQGELYNGTPLTQKLLDKYLWDQPMPGLETTSLEYLTRVGKDIRDPYSEDLATVETTNLPIVEQSGNGLVPAAPRAEYFPVLLEAAPQQPHAVLGLDRANDELYRLALLQARDSGMIAVYTHFPVIGVGSQEQTAYHLLPIYANGMLPATVEDRRRDLRGYLAAATYVPGDTVFALDNIGGISSTYFLQADDLYSNPDFAWIQEQLHTGKALEINYSDVTLGLPFAAIGMASDALRMTLATNARWWALSLGLMMTTGISALMWWMRNQSRRIKSLVIARTLTLQQRTDALGNANAALRLSETRYRMLADNASDVIFTCDFGGKYNYVSPAVAMQRGFAPDELVGKSITTHLPAESAQVIRNKLAEGAALMSRRGELSQPAFEDSFEFQGRCQDGSTKWLETSLSLLLDADGKASGMLGVTRDISERKQAEFERQRLQEAWRQAQKMEAIGTLAGGIAHDFNNLLTAIFGYADILRLQVAPNREAEQSIGIIEKAATRASDLTSQLLGFARKGRFQAKPVNLNETVDDVIALLRSTVDKKITLVGNLSTRQPWMVGDPGQLSHLFLNLGINARDAMPQGGSLSFTLEIVELSQAFCRKHPDLRPGPYNLITVADTGIGIPRENLRRIFEPFFTNKEQGRGTGLGLAMVYGVATGHAGTVTVESEQGRGATFRVYLPYAESSDVRVAEKQELLIKGTGTVLVVDDEEMIRNLASNMLGELGYTILVAEDGAVAVEIYRGHFADIGLVIVDMIMPGMDGTQCILALKAINPDVKVILATGYSRETLGETINRDDIAGFLQKPYNKQQLSNLVAEVLRG